ncbi:MAG: hypothetical protein HYT12_00670 [Candidatus Liptonbacteria bacterium]|nr:hypothetical protein [Candidatus Liptonbacteria bacterium]
MSVFGLVLIVIGSFGLTILISYSCGSSDGRSGARGELCDSFDLVHGEIYETICCVKRDGHAQWFAVIKDRHGTWRAYRFNDEPPGVFKVVRGRDRTGEYVVLHTYPRLPAVPAVLG